MAKKKKAKKTLNCDNEVKKPDCDNEASTPTEPTTTDSKQKKNSRAKTSKNIQFLTKLTRGLLIEALNNTCCCCLEKIKEDPQTLDEMGLAFIDVCAHTFHYDCIKKWSKYETSCPLCKTIFTYIAKYDHNKGERTLVERCEEILQADQSSSDDHNEVEDSDENEEEYLEYTIRRPYRRVHHRQIETSSSDIHNKDSTNLGSHTLHNKKRGRMNSLRTLQIASSDEDIIPSKSSLLFKRKPISAEKAKEKTERNLASLPYNTNIYTPTITQGKSQSSATSNLDTEHFSFTFTHTNQPVRVNEKSLEQPRLLSQPVVIRKLRRPNRNPISTTTNKQQNRHTQPINPPLASLIPHPLAKSSISRTLNAHTYNNTTQSTITSTQIPFSTSGPVGTFTHTSKPIFDFKAPTFNLNPTFEDDFLMAKKD